MNWGAFDLNLLIVFDAVMHERNVTRAGGKIGLSQPAVSHALSRLHYMPGIRLDLRPTGLRDMPALLDRGALDLAIGIFEDAGERFATAPLLEDSFVVVMRRDHPTAQREFTEEALAALSYLEISSSGENSSFIDQWLATRGLARKITHRAPRLSAAAILSITDMVAGA
jgi:DNA-binding transcriptional LysR family regulator